MTVSVLHLSLSTCQEIREWTVECKEWGILLAVSPTTHISTGTNPGIAMRNFIFSEGLGAVHPGQRASEQVSTSLSPWYLLIVSPAGGNYLISRTDELVPPRLSSLGYHLELGLMIMTWKMVTVNWQWSPDIFLVREAFKVEQNIWVFRPRHPLFVVI